MITLWITALITSAIDSLNPIAISQQFVLQGLVKNKHHIWFFIVSIAFTNFLAGILAYYGLLTPLSRFFLNIVQSMGIFLYTLELFLAILLALYTLKHLKSYRYKEKTEAQPKKYSSLSRLTLTFIGITATLLELTSALPYFAFLTILINHSMSVYNLILILIFYNIVYSIPLILLAILYAKAHHHFNAIYHMFNRFLSKWSQILTPLLLGFISCALAIHALLHLFT